jgi:hypothetical protein
MIARTAAATAAALLAGLTAATPALADPVTHVPATYTLLADADHQPVLLMGGRTVPVTERVTDRLTPGQQVTATVRGATGSPAAVADAVQGGRAVVTATRPTPAALTDDIAGAHTLTIVPVTNAANTDGTTATVLRDEARRLGAFWSAQTSGALTVADSGITVDDWVTSAAIPAGDCDPDQWKDAALAAIGRTEADFSGRDHLVVYLGKNAATTCGWTGLAYMPGNIIWINGYTYADAFEHEFGHNLGLDHAGDQTCTITFNGKTCKDVEYGDYDVMGYGRYGDGNGLNTAKADQLGLLDAVTPAAGTRVTIAPRLDRSAVRALKVGGSTATYYVEYRPDTVGAGEAGDSSPGVQIRQVRNDSQLSTLIAALRYTGDPDPDSVAVNPGQAVALPGTGYDVVVDSITAAGAVMHLRTSATGTVGAPTLTDPVDGGASALNATIRWSAPDVSADAIAGYLLQVDGTSYVQGPATTSRTLALKAGSHTVTIATLGMRGTVSATRTATFTAGGTLTAGPAVTFPAQAGTTTVLRWQAVPGAGKYEVTVDGSTRTVAAGTTKLVLTLTRGTHTAAVRSYDTAGTASSATTGTITVTRTWAATAAKITAPANNARVASTVTVRWAAPTTRAGDPAVTGYDVRLDSGSWVTLGASSRSRALTVAKGKHTLTVRTRYESGATASTAVKVTR